MSEQEAATQQTEELAPSPEATQGTETLAPSTEATAATEELAPQQEISNKAQDEINRNVRKRYDAERRALAAEQQLQQLQQQAQQAPAVSNAAPKEEDFYDDADPDAYHKALARHEARQEFATLQQQQAQQVQLAEQRKKEQSYTEKAEAFRAKAQDFQESVGSMPLKNQTATDAIFASENGPAVAYHLSKNLDVVDRINQMDPLNAALEIGRIEAKLSATPAPKTPTAPDPIEPIGSGGVASKSINDMSVAELIEHEAAKKRAQGA